MSSNSGPQGYKGHSDGYVDVTDTFFEAVASMVPGKVVASPYFDMLDGARAVEMGNLRLDTGLVPLEKADVQFDSLQGLQLDAVAAIMNKIVVLYMSWLDGLSLLLTMFGSRHVLDYLEGFKILGDHRSGFLVRKERNWAEVGKILEEVRNLQKTTDTGTSESANTNSQSKEIIDTDSQGLSGPESADIILQNTNLVLRAFVAAMCKFAGFTRAVGTTVLYDEEDLTTRTMDFDLLSLVPTPEIVEELEKAQTWLDKHPQPNDDQVSIYLNLANSLIHLEGLLKVNLPLFTPAQATVPAVTSALEHLSHITYEKFQAVPEGAFSQFAQVDCNNKHIPNLNFAIADEEAYAGLKSLLEHVQEFIKDLASISHVGELAMYLQYSVAPKMGPEYNVIARGLFQLFFIRDDRSICGLLETVTLITLAMMQRLCCCGNPMLTPNQWPIEDQEPISRLLEDVEAAMYMSLSVGGNNRCRQRQLNTRSILTWDSLQFSAETTELALWKKGLGDRADESEPALAVSSFVYHTKLGVMLDVVLSGFELHLYKVHEAAHMYWYAGYLAQMAHDHLISRVQRVNQSKIGMGASMAKKVKKAKAGPKKEALKKAHRVLVDYVVPEIQQNMLHIQNYEIPAQLATHLLCTSVAQALHLFEAFGAAVAKPKALASPEALYKLRMKPWSSVGVPELPTYSQYCAATTSHREVAGTSAARLENAAAGVRERFGRALAICTDIISRLDAETAFCGTTDAKAHFEGFRKTCAAYQVELSRFSLVLRKEKEAKNDKYKVEVQPGYHAYFPLYGLKKISA